MSDLPDTRKKICCIGEVLWDALPEGLYLGGAPLNVCCHLTALGEEALMVSRVGRDRLGKETRRTLRGRGVQTGYIQVDEERETGFVEVNLSQKEGPAYEIIEPAAWDFISFSDEVKELAGTVDVVVFGTLGQRNEISRRTIRQLIKGSAVSVYDVNLRPPFDDQSVVEFSLREADIVKMNNDELLILAEWFNLPGQQGKAIKQLAESFDCQQVCITCGSGGAILYNEGLWTRQEGVEVDVVDTIGSGDAFLAAFIYGLAHLKTDQERLRFANLLGAFVATKSGANPSYSLKDIEDFARKWSVSIDLV